MRRPSRRRAFACSRSSPSTRPSARRPSRRRRHPRRARRPLRRARTRRVRRAAGKRTARLEGSARSRAREHSRCPRPSRASGTSRRGRSSRLVPVGVLVRRCVPRGPQGRRGARRVTGRALRPGPSPLENGRRGAGGAPGGRRDRPSRARAGARVVSGARRRRGSSDRARRARDRDCAVRPRTRPDAACSRALACSRGWRRRVWRGDRARRARLARRRSRRVHERRTSSSERTSWRAVLDDEIATGHAASNLAELRLVQQRLDEARELLVMALTAYEAVRLYDGASYALEAAALVAGRGRTQRGRRPSPRGRRRASKRGRRPDLGAAAQPLRDAEGLVRGKRSATRRSGPPGRRGKLSVSTPRSAPLAERFAESRRDALDAAGSPRLVLVREPD